MKRSFCIAGAIALAFTFTPPAPVEALDLGKTVKKVTRGVSKALGGGGGSGSSSAGSSSGSTSSTGGKTGTSAKASIGKGGIKLDLNTGLLGGTGVSVKALGDDGLASANASVGNNRVRADVLSRGQLASLGLSSNPRGTSRVRTPDGGVRGVTPDYVRQLMAGLSRQEKVVFQIKCANVLRSPKAFDSELIALCRIAKQIS